MVANVEDDVDGIVNDFLVLLPMLVVLLQFKLVQQFGFLNDAFMDHF